MKMKMLRTALVSGLCLALAGGAVYTGWDKEVKAEAKNGNDAEAYIPSVNKEDAAAITLSQDGSTCSGSGVSIAGNTITISQAGTYVLSGTLANGEVVVSAGKKDSVILILDNVSITNMSGAAIYVENSGDFALYLEEGSQNTLVSGTEKEISADAADAEAEGGAITFKDDATILGNGSLTVYGYLNNGIHASNNLFIESGALNVTAVNNGIKGKDSLTVDGGSVNILSGGDALKSDSEDGSGYGVITINNGSVKIASYGDGADAMTSLAVNGGSVEIMTYGDAITHTDSFGGFGGGGRGGFGGFGNMNTYADADDAGGTSTKGLKSHGDLSVSGGAISIDSVDDALHCDGELSITGGTITLSTQDDGIHADGSLVIAEASITINASYEGIEAHLITVDSGNISLTATDDGFNANGGSSYGGFGMFGGYSSQEASDMPVLTINGGNIFVNAYGDGLDSNGNMIINGGDIIVDGPNNSGNGSLDAGTEIGGSIAVNGGTLLAIGASGMAETPGSASTQCSFSVNINFAAGDEITVKDASGNVLTRYTALKSGNNIVFSAPSLAIGETYTVTAGSSESSVTLTDIVTGGYGGFGMMGGGRGGMGRFRDGTQQGMPEGSSWGTPGEMPDGGSWGTPGQMPEGGRRGMPGQMPESGQQGMNAPMGGDAFMGSQTVDVQ